MFFYHHLIPFLVKIIIIQIILGYIPFEKYMKLTLTLAGRVQPVPLFSKEGGGEITNSHISFQ